MSKFCIIPGCNNLTYAEESKNLKFSKLYCQEHSKGIHVKCSVCGEEKISRPTDYIKIIKSNKPIICRKCSINKLNSELDKSEIMKRINEKNKINGYKKICSHCGKEFKGNSSRQMFCKDCSDVELVCSECNKVFYIKRNKYNKDKKYYCSIKCSVAAQHKFMAKNNLNYYKNQRKASIKANEIMKKNNLGVWSKEQHIKAETTKKINGTDLGNKDFRIKIGCNGNPQYVIDKWIENKIGIFSDDSRKKSIEWHEKYWGDILKDLIKQGKYKLFQQGCLYCNNIDLWLEKHKEYHLNKEQIEKLQIEKYGKLFKDLTKEDKIKYLNQYNKVKCFIMPYEEAKSILINKGNEINLYVKEISDIPEEYWKLPCCWQIMKNDKIIYSAQTKRLRNEKKHIKAILNKKWNGKNNRNLSMKEDPTHINISHIWSEESDKYKDNTLEERLAIESIKDHDAIVSVGNI